MRLRTAAMMPDTTLDRSLLARGLHDWPRRLAEEAPLLERVLSAAPSKRVLDLGCGGGEHARFLAGRGFEVIGIDASEAALDAAQQQPIPDGVQFILTDLGAVERSVRGHFGAALCLGNTLPHLLSPESVSRMLVGLKRRLLPGAPLVLQLLNYEPVLAGGQRALPVRFIDGPGGELILVRLVEGRADGIVLHTTSALRHRPGEEPPLEVVATHQSQLRGWRRSEIETMLEIARLPAREIHGDMGTAPFDPRRSPELVVVAAGE